MADSLSERVLAIRDRYTMACPDKPDAPFAILTEAAAELTRLQAAGRAAPEVTAEMVDAGRKALFVRRYARAVEVVNGDRPAVGVDGDEMADDARACLEAALALITSRAAPDREAVTGLADQGGAEG